MGLDLYPTPIEKDSIYYYLFISKTCMYPELYIGYLFNPIAFCSTNEFVEWNYIHDEQCRKALSNKKLDKWLIVNQVVNVNLNEWEALTCLVQDGLVLEVNDILQQRSKSVKEQEDKFKKNLESTVKLPHQVTSNLGKFLNK